MSAHRMPVIGGFEFLSEPPPVNTRLTLPASSVCIRKNGIEFRSAAPISLWTEMTVGLEAPESDRKLQCSGVVVACSGNRQSGYLVSLLFMNLSRRSQAVLDSLGVS